MVRPDYHKYLTCRQNQLGFTAKLHFTTSRAVGNMLFKTESSIARRGSPHLIHMDLKRHLPEEKHPLVVPSSIYKVTT